MRAIPVSGYVSILLQYPHVHDGFGNSAVENSSVRVSPPCGHWQGAPNVEAAPPLASPFSREREGGEGRPFASSQITLYQCRTAILTVDPAGSSAAVNSGIQTTTINSMNNATRVISLMTATSYFLHN
jgi:hypothetical protein